MVGGADFPEWMRRHRLDAIGVVGASAASVLAPILAWYALPLADFRAAMFHAGSLLYVASYLLSLVALDQWRPFRRPWVGVGLALLVALVGFMMFFAGDSLVLSAHDQFAPSYDCSRDPSESLRCQAAWHWLDDLDQFIGWFIFALLVNVPIGATFGFLRGRRYRRLRRAGQALELDAPAPSIEPTYSTWSDRGRK